MHVNSDWVYRKVHVFYVLINIRNNRILSISPALSSLFAHESDFGFYLNHLIASLQGKQRTSLMSCIAYLENAGVLTDA